MQSITFQPSLRPALPEVNGCKEYREERQLLIRIDELLQTSGLENDFIDLCLQHRGDDPKKITAKRLDSIARHSVLALFAGTHRPAGPIEFGLKTDIDFDDIYFDSTCLKAPIHFPVDWVLLRDATRTLMKATALIRQAGLCPRDVSELRDRLKNEPGMREGMKRRAGTEARISIIIRDFMGKAPRVKGFEHREMMVGWAVLSHKLWVLARLEQVKEEDKIEDQVPEAA